MLILRKSLNSKLERGPQRNAVIRAYTFPFVVIVVVVICLHDYLINVGSSPLHCVFMVSESVSVFLTIGSLGLCVESGT